MDIPRPENKKRKRIRQIAIGSGTDVAVESAGLILVKSNPMDVVKMIRLSRASRRKMKQNIWWGEAGWILEDNAAMNTSLEKMMFRVYKTYRLYDRSI